jgi:hypothetical protein
MMEKLKNRFLFWEWSGSIGDLRTLLPLAVALAVGFISFATRNLTITLVAGLILE